MICWLSSFSVASNRYKQKKSAIFKYVLFLCWCIYELNYLLLALGFGICICKNILVSFYWKSIYGCWNSTATYIIHYIHFCEMFMLNWKFYESHIIKYNEYTNIIISFYYEQPAIYRKIKKRNFRIFAIIRRRQL